MKLKLVAGLVALSCIAGCSQSPQPAVDKTVATKAPKTIAAPAPTPAMPAPACEFCAVPATVRRCEINKGLRTTLYWDVTSKGVDGVVVYVVDRQGVDKNFGGKRPAKDGIVTGPYLWPDIQFKIKDFQGKELGTVTIAGVDC